MLELTDEESEVVVRVLKEVIQRSVARFGPGASEIIQGLIMRGEKNRG